MGNAVYHRARGGSKYCHDMQFDCKVTSCDAKWLEYMYHKSTESTAPVTWKVLQSRAHAHAATASSTYENTNVNTILIVEQKAVAIKLITPHEGWLC